MNCLVDTSSWIQFLRHDGDAVVCERVRRILLSGWACWCPMIRLELWNGARGDREKAVLKEFEAELPELPIDQAVWQLSFEMARRARAAGLTIPATDLLIASCARHHGAVLEHSDADFDRLSEVVPE